MASRGSRLVLVACAALLVVACGTTLPDPSARDVARAEPHVPGADLALLERGRDLYVARCGNCHQLRAPESRTFAQWELDVAKMRRRANLTPDRERAILAYLAAFARAPREAQGAQNGPAARSD